MSANATTVGPAYAASTARSCARVLLLDEPTNHLAPAQVGELEEALAAYAGALVMVSHDCQLGAWFAGRLGGTGPGAELRPVGGRVAPFPLAV